MSAGDNARTVRRYFDEVLNQADLGVLDEIALDDVVDHMAVRNGWATGRAGLAHHVDVYLGAFPGAHATIERFVASDDEVAVLWTARSSVDDPTEIGIVASFFTMSGGKIAEYLIGGMSGFGPDSATEEVGSDV